MILDIYEIEWIDSQGYGGWHDKEEIQKWNENLLCKSVGYLLREDKDRIVLVSSESEHSYLDALAIPKICIKNMKKLKGDNQ